ncbi:MAG TPA: dihydrodipicolinate synthase family protein [Opitutaceae bacterium]|nr:dihydrodipicolinate synthase family protein [Opitutaceae bacterium]
MAVFQPGLVHTPVTPFTREGRVDHETYGKLIEFHLKHGAEALALPMHAGESVSLKDEERRALLEFALKCVKGRVPVIAHISQSGTGMAAALAKHAEGAGAAALVAVVPYYWTPPAGMLIEHFAAIAAAVKIPLYLYDAPDEMADVKITTDVALKLLERAPNFAGLIDTSRDWQFMIDLISSARRVRPDFQLLSGTEYLISARAIGASGALCPLAAIAPKHVRSLFDLCRTERYPEALKVQQEIADLKGILRSDAPALKAALAAMGRACGGPRPPLTALREVEQGALGEALRAHPALRSEPVGW